MRFVDCIAEQQILTTILQAVKAHVYPKMKEIITPQKLTSPLGLRYLPAYCKDHSNIKDRIQSKKSLLCRQFKVLFNDHKRLARSVSTVDHQQLL